MKKITIKIRRKAGAEDLPLPSYATSGSSGADVYADVRGEFLIRPGEIRLVPCGIYLEIPPGYEAQIRPRSGLALKYGITLVNTPGTIDSDYRGLLNLIVTNLGKEPFRVERGMRMAQMVINEVVRMEFEEVAELVTTERGEKGFGHTGV